MAQSLKKKKQNCSNIGKQSIDKIVPQFNSINCVDELPQLWNTYNSLPDSVERDYVWDEIFTSLSSLLKVVLKNTPESERQTRNEGASISIN